MPFGPGFSPVCLPIQFTHLFLLATTWCWGSWRRGLPSFYCLGNLRLLKALMMTPDGVPHFTFHPRPICLTSLKLPLRSQCPRVLQMNSASPPVRASARLTSLENGTISFLLSSQKARSHPGHRIPPLHPHPNLTNLLTNP